MLRNIIFVLCCSFIQSNAFVLPNAVFAEYENNLGESSVNDHQLEKKAPPNYFPEFPFESAPNVNDVPFQANFPQYGMQFGTNGLQTGLSSGFNIPLPNGNTIDPGGDLFRDLNPFNQPFPQNGVVSGTLQPMNQYGTREPQFKTETFEMTPNGQKLYENDKLVEELPNVQTPTMQNTPQQNPIPQNTPQQNPIPQTPVAQVQNNNMKPSDVQSPMQPLQNSQTNLPNPNLSPQAQPMLTSPQQQPNYPSQNQPVVKISSTGASSSTMVSSTNNQPPEMTQNAGAYNYNYDSTKPNPTSGAYAAVNGYTPNMNDPDQGVYQYSHGSFPNQQNPSAYTQNPFNPAQGNYKPSLGRLNQPNTVEYNPNMFNFNGMKHNEPQGTQPINQNTNLKNPQFPQQTITQNDGSNNGYVPQNYPTPHTQFNNGHLPMANQIQNLNRIAGYQVVDPNILNRLHGHVNSLGLPMNPSAIAAPLSQFFQTFPRLLQNAANQGLQITKMPFDMLNAALDAFNTDLSNVHINEFVQIPTQGGRAIVNSIEEMINQMQNNLQQMQMQQPSLARRSPEPWMVPNFDMSQYYNSIPFGTAQQKITDMKNDIYNKIQTPMFTQIQNMPQMPQPSANGEPVVKVFSSSVSESTQSSSKNGAPPEVSHQAAGYKYDYDSTKKDNPVQSDLVALKGYTPNANDPTQGTFVAYENAFP